MPLYNHAYTIRLVHFAPTSFSALPTLTILANNNHLQYVEKSSLIIVKFCTQILPFEIQF